MKIGRKIKLSAFITFVACPHPLYCCIYTALIPCIAVYILPLFPVLLYIYCPHPLSCVTYSALVSLLFGTAYVIPTSFNILMEMFLLPLLNKNDVLQLVIIMAHTRQVQTVHFLECTLLSVK